MTEVMPAMPGEMGGGGESAEAVFRAMKSYLVGHDPARLEEMRFLIANPTASLYNNRTQVLAALEFACLDILGQKWGVPVWSHGGILCTGETYKNVVKLTFLKGAQLKDPARLFNSSLEGNARRAIDIHEGEKLDEPAFKALIRNAAALNTSSRRG